MLQAMYKMRGIAARLKDGAKSRHVQVDAKGGLLWDSLYRTVYKRCKVGDTVGRGTGCDGQAPREGDGCGLDEP